MLGRDDTPARQQHALPKLRPMASILPAIISVWSFPKEPEAIRERLQEEYAMAALGPAVFHA